MVQRTVGVMDLRGVRTKNGVLLDKERICHYI